MLSRALHAFSFESSGAGSLLVEILQHSAASRGQGGFLQLAGVRYALGSACALCSTQLALNLLSYAYNPNLPGENQVITAQIFDATYESLFLSVLLVNLNSSQTWGPIDIGQYYKIGQRLVLQL